VCGKLGIVQYHHFSKCAVLHRILENDRSISEKMRLDDAAVTFKHFIDDVLDKRDHYVCDLRLFLDKLKGIETFILHFKMAYFDYDIRRIWKDCRCKEKALFGKDHKNLVYILCQFHSKKRYVGETVDMRKRLSKHLYEGRKQKVRHIYVLMRKIGLEKWFYIPVQFVSGVKSERYKIEKQWMHRYRNFIINEKWTWPGVNVDCGRKCRHGERTVAWKTMQNSVLHEVTDLLNEKHWLDIDEDYILVCLVYVSPIDTPP